MGRMGGEEATTFRRGADPGVQEAYSKTNQLIMLSQQEETSGRIESSQQKKNSKHTDLAAVGRKPWTQADPPKNRLPVLPCRLGLLIEIEDHRCIQVWLVNE